MLDTPDDQRKQIVATRIFIVLFLFITVVLTINSSQTSVTHEIIISRPSLEEYFRSHARYAQALICPCERIVVERSTFLVIEPVFHQVCQSNFVDYRWAYGIARSFMGVLGEILPNYTVIDLSVVPATDFRLVGTPFFRTLSSLCETSKLTLEDWIESFGRIPFTTAELVPQQIFERQGQALIDLLYSTSLTDFIHTIRLNQDWIYFNDLLAGVQPVSTWNLYISNPFVQVTILRRVFNMSNSSCSCFENRYCVEQVTFYSRSNVTRRYPTPQLYYGCSIIDALLQSNLAFLYDQYWIHEVRQLVEFDWTDELNLTTSALNASLPSRYNPNTSLSGIVENMMTEEWSTYVNYSAYYEQCRPIVCRYTYEEKYDAIYIITTVIGLIGGVVTILQLGVPTLVHFAFKYCLQHRRHRVVAFSEKN